MLPLSRVVTDVATADDAADLAVSAVVVAGACSFYVVVGVAAIVVIVVAADIVSLRSVASAAAFAVGVCTAAPAATAVVFLLVDVRLLQLRLLCVICFVRRLCLYTC